MNKKLSSVRCLLVDKMSITVEGGETGRLTFAMIADWRQMDYYRIGINE